MFTIPKRLAMMVPAPASGPELENLLSRAVVSNLGPSRDGIVMANDGIAKQCCHS
jgi:hypothetical protein